MVGKEDKVKTTALKTTRPHQRPDLLRHIALLCLCGPFLLSTTYAFVGPQVSGSRQTLKLFETVDENGNTTTTTAASVEVTRPKRIRSLVKDVAKMVVPRPLISSAYAQPDAIAEVIKEAAFLAVDEALQLRGSSAKGPKATISNHDEVSEDGGTSNIATLLLDEEGMEALIAEAFDPLEQSLDNLEESLHQARNSMAAAKEAVRAVHAAAREQVQDAVTAARLAQEVASREAVAEMYAAVNDVDVESLTYDDVDFAASQMTPPFLGDDQCLVPGEPIVRVEKAPQNSRRIFAGIDILASVDTVWEVLTDYSNLQNVVPNLAVNTVAQTFESKNAAEMLVDEFRPELEQCQELSCLLKGAVLKQVGKAKVAGLKFSARTTLEVREWPQGLPDFAHFYDEIWQGRTRQERFREYEKIPLQRYAFPRPFAISKLPHRDITMQSVVDDDGEFRLYQGVWRLQPLPGCIPEGSGLNAMRLTYAVEVSPRAFLPVQLIEGRIAKDLCTNLIAIRQFVSKKEAAQDEVLNHDTA